MEPNELQQHQHQLNSSSSSYFNSAAAASLSSPTNGLLGGPHTTQRQLSSADNTNMAFTSSMTSPPPVEAVKRKRGRPRKYGTPEQALAAKKAATSSSQYSYKPKKKKQQQHTSYSGPTNKAQQQLSSASGNSGQGLIPHVFNLVAGEDVGEKSMAFMRQSKRDICILSASGSISNASICQPATSGGSVTYEGHFEIVSLSGSYVHTHEGKAGGMSVCLSSTNGHIIGGGVGGPLTAAGPVQVIIGTFLANNKNEVNTGVNTEFSIPSVGGASMMNAGFRKTVNSSGRNMVSANDEQYQAMGGSHFMTQGVHGSADWRVGPNASNSTGSYELGGLGGHAHQSPESGDYD